MTPAWVVILTLTAPSHGCQPCDRMGISSFQECGRACSPGGHEWTRTSGIYKCLCAYPETITLCDNSCDSIHVAQAQSNAPTSSSVYYFKQTNGACDHYVNSLSACNAAARYLNNSDTSAMTVHWEDFHPTGCYIYLDGSLYFNPTPVRSARGKCSTLDTCVCVSTALPIPPKVPPPTSSHYWRTLKSCPFPVTSVDDCNAGSLNIGSSNRRVFLPFESQNHPYGCSSDSEKKNLFFNSLATSQVDCSPNRPCLCASTSPPGYSPTKPPTASPSSPSPSPPKSPTVSSCEKSGIANRTNLPAFCSNYTDCMFKCSASYSVSVGSNCMMTLTPAEVQGCTCYPGTGLMKASGPVVIFFPNNISATVTLSSTTNDDFDSQIYIEYSNQGLQCRGTYAYSSTENNDDNDYTLLYIVVAAGGVGALLFLCCLCIICCCCCKRKPKRQNLDVANPMFALSQHEQGNASGWISTEVVRTPDSSIHDFIDRYNDDSTT